VEENILLEDLRFTTEEISKLTSNIGTRVIILSVQRQLQEEMDQGLTENSITQVAPVAPGTPHLEKEQLKQNMSNFIAASRKLWSKTTI